ncbi:MAG: hypothetical protein U0174_09885 [Polyangiaceae bacterium]
MHSGRSASLLLVLLASGCDKISAAMSDEKPTAQPTATAQPSAVVATGSTTSGTSDQGAAGLAAAPIAATPGPFATKPGAEGGLELYRTNTGITHFGFLKAGGFAVCSTSAGAREVKSVPFCRIARPTGTTLEKDKKPGDIDAFVNREDLTLLFPETKAEERRAQHMPSTVGASVPGAPKRNTWKYGSTIAFGVRTDPKSLTISLGGFALGEEAVYPVLLTTAAFPEAKKPGTLPNIAGPFISVDGRYIAAFSSYRCTTPCLDSINVYFAPVDRFAASIANEQGYRYYSQKAYKKAADRFATGAATDPTWELPRYNEACAYALAVDEKHSEEALQDAIVRGGPKIKERARKDKDFTAYKNAPWFRRLTD